MKYYSRVYYRGYVITKSSHKGHQKAEVISSNGIVKTSFSGRNIRLAESQAKEYIDKCCGNISKGQSYETNYNSIFGNKHRWSQKTDSESPKQPKEKKKKLKKIIQCPHCANNYKRSKERCPTCKFPKQKEEQSWDY